MLETLDILIGFTVVMLVISMAVTMITQAIGSALINLRGWCLKEGVSRLLALMDQGLKLADARAITDHVLRNPLVGRAAVLAPIRHGGQALASGLGRLVGRPAGSPPVRQGYALATVIHREELIRLLLDFAVPGDAEKANLNNLPAEDLLRNKFRKSLKNNGIDDPAAVLQAVRNAVVELEKTNPELSHSARIGVALLNFAASDFLNKFNSWFDQVMDRVADLFTRQIRAITAIVALVLALALQLDSIGLINRLSVDETLRNELVRKAIDEQPAFQARIEAQQAEQARLQERLRRPGAAGTADTAERGNVAATQAPAQTADPAPTNIAAPAPAANESVTDNAVGSAPAAGEGERKGGATPSEPRTAGEPEDPLVEARRSVEELGVVTLPKTWAQWSAAWWERAEPPAAGMRFRGGMLFGVLLSAALLSLGAPFWYAVLANLLKLRSVLARKDEMQRVERQTTQTVTTSATVTGGAADGALPPSLAGGERGDLAATG